MVNSMNELAEKLKAMTESVNNAIIFLNNHHYNTKKLRVSVEEFVEINELIVTDLEIKLINIKEYIEKNENL